MNTNNDKIISDVKELLNYFKNPLVKDRMKTNKEECIKDALEIYGSFFDKYPALFGMISQNPEGFDMKRLYEMLNLKNKVKNNEISYKDASVGIGYKYYNEYVKPNIDNDKNT